MSTNNQNQIEMSTNEKTQNKVILNSENDIRKMNTQSANEIKTLDRTIAYNPGAFIPAPTHQIILIFRNSLSPDATFAKKRSEIRQRIGFDRIPHKGVIPMLLNGSIDFLNLSL